MALSFFLILLPGLPVKNSLPVEQTHSANIISFSIYENENEPRLDDFLPLFVCFGTKIFSQHQTSTTLLGLVRENRATPVLTRSLVRSPTSTPKPRAEGSSPSAPAKNRRKHCVSAGFLFLCVVWLRCSCWFRQWLFASVCTCLQPLSSPPAPGTHPVLPFFGFSGYVFVFSAFLDAQNFRPGFCALCRIAFTG